MGGKSLQPPELSTVGKRARILPPNEFGRCPNFIGIWDWVSVSNLASNCVHGFADILLTSVEGHRGTTRTYRYNLDSCAKIPRDANRYKMTARDN